jgi:hypothetical protein
MQDEAGYFSIHGHRMDDERNKKITASRGPPALRGSPPGQQGSNDRVNEEDDCEDGEGGSPLGGAAGEVPLPAPPDQDEDSRAAGDRERCEYREEGECLAKIGGGAGSENDQDTSDEDGDDGVEARSKGE